MLKNNPIKGNLDIIIINYNSTDTTCECIESINQNILKYTRQIIVIDNNSKDSPQNILKKYPQVTYIQNDKNYGFGKAVNIAVKKSNSEYFMLINPDTKLIDKSIGNAIVYMENHPEVSICGPMILELNGKIQGSARKFPSFWSSIFGRKSPLTKLYPNNPITKREFLCFNENYNKAQDVDWVSGACVLIKRDAFDKIGGFDEDFFLYWEDTDLCKRMHSYGWRVIYFPHARVVHAVGKSSSTCPFTSVFYFHKSSFILYRKHCKSLMFLFAPLVAFGLNIRCLFVMFLIYVDKIKKNKIFEVFNKSGVCQKESTNKTKVLRIVSRLNIGGPSIHCSILSKSLNPDLYVTKLVTGSISPSEGDMSYLFKNKNNFIRIPELQREINLIKDLIAFFKILKLLVNYQPDIVHTHMAKAGAVSRAGVFFYNLFSDKKIITIHTYHGHVLDGYFGLIKSKLFILIEKILALSTNAIIAISQTQKWELSEKYRISQPEKVHIINLGLNLKPFMDLDSYKDLFKKKLGLDDSCAVIGIVGRLVPIKNHKMFLDAAKSLIDSYTSRDLKFVLIGDGELRQKLQFYTDQIGIKEKVIFFGWEQDIRLVYRGLDILALTSNNEGTPVSIIEAMASGVPVITTGVGGVKDLLGTFQKNNGNESDFKICERGILCQKGDYWAMAQGIKYILNNNGMENSKRIARSKEYVFKNYSNTRLVNEVEKLYQQLIKESCNDHLEQSITTLKKSL